ncbi:MAG: hypothetical protein ABR584_06190 [Candidatus Baltobacteraceae bacterium]
MIRYERVAWGRREAPALCFAFCPKCDNGDSGAGVFNVRGELTGILVSKVFVDAPSAASGKRDPRVVFFMEPLDRTRAFAASKVK